MSLPNSLKSIRMTNATTGDQVDDKVAELETALCDIHGIPIDTPVAAPGFLWDATGLKKVIFKDNAADPGSVGEIARNGTAWKMHNGLYACGVPQTVNNNNAAVTFSDTIGEVPFFNFTLKGGSLGGTGRLRLTAIGKLNGILAGATNFVQLRANWGAVANLVVHTLFGGSVTPRSGGDWRWVLEIYMNGSSISYRVVSQISVVGFSVPNSSDFPGFGTNDGPTTDIRIQEGVTIDLSVDRTLQLSFAWNNPNPSNIISYYQSMLEILP